MRLSDNIRRGSYIKFSSEFYHGVEHVGRVNRVFNGGTLLDVVDYDGNRVTIWKGSAKHIRASHFQELVRRAYAFVSPGDPDVWTMNPIIEL